MKIFILILFSILSIYSSENFCLGIIKLHKVQKLNLYDLIKRDIEKFDGKCVEELIKRGYIKEAEYLVDQSKLNGVDLSENVKKAANNVKEKVISIYKNFALDESDYTNIFPSYEWAQSMNYIFINIKYSHKWSAPGCVEVSKEHTTIFENLVMQTAYCFMGDNPMKFILNLDLYDHINEKESKFSSSSVGRYMLTLKKQNNSYWKSLHRKGADQPDNMRVWIEMSQKYYNETEKYINDSEEEEVSKLTSEIESIKKKRAKKNDL